MADPLTLAIATAVAGKSAEVMTEQARQAISVIVQKIRAKFSTHPHDAAVLDTATRGESEPDALVQLLEREFAADPAFRSEIRALWLQAAPNATDDAVSNAFYGKADKVIQLRDVHGDLTIS
jgi:hypothetical protein